MPLASAGSLAAWEWETPLVEGKQLPRAVKISTSAVVAGLWQCGRLPTVRGHLKCKLHCIPCQDRGTSEFADRSHGGDLNESEFGIKGTLLPAVRGQPLPRQAPPVLWKPEEGIVMGRAPRE